MGGLMAENLNDGSTENMPSKPKGKARGTHKHKMLSDKEAAKLVRKGKPAFVHDGDGLYLDITGIDCARWILRATVHGDRPKPSRSDIGLGPYREMMVVEDARLKAMQLKKRIRDENFDPAAENQAKKEQEQEVRKSEAKQAEIRSTMPTFEKCARAKHEIVKQSFTNDDHADQWIKTLETYAFKIMGTTPVDQVDADMIETVLKPIWLTKKETATRVAQRISAVLDYAIAKKYRTDNPVAAVRKSILPDQGSKKKHFPALPWQRVPEFIQDLRRYPGESARLAYEFKVITAKRSQEVLQMKWTEIDEANAKWTIPAHRLKIKDNGDHEEPLPKRALEILARAKEISDGGPYVFPGPKQGKPFSDAAFNTVMDGIDAGGKKYFDPKQPIDPTDPSKGFERAVAHGFRSSFRDWAEMKTNFKDTVLDVALAHRVAKDKTSSAYLRTKLYEQRQKLMQLWSEYCTTSTATTKVVSIRTA
jgi:integrase